jgi:hypothetical protein
VGLGVLALWAVSGAVLVRVGWGRPGERFRAAGLLLFLAGSAGLALALGRGRAGLGPGSGPLSRYVTFMAPALCCVYFVAELYGSRAVARWLPRGLFLVAAAVCWPNAQAAADFGGERRARMEAVEEDVREGTPHTVLAERHARFLYLPEHPDVLAERLRLLHRAGSGALRSLHVAPNFAEAERQLRDRKAADEERYARLGEQLRAVVRRTLPAGATVLVASKGDDELLRLEGRRAWHFPQTDEGEYAGYEPADSREAIAQLEALRARGADFLLLPYTAFWWLEEYRGFRRHLEKQYRLVVREENVCLIFALR